MFDEGELDIPDTVLLIEVIGLVLNILITFRHRTSVYRARKKITNVKIRLDLNKERHALLLEANNLVKGNNDVKFCFVDINCCLKTKWEDELRPGIFFSSLKDLTGKLQVN